MEHVEEIACIKDGVTGVCRDICDDKARTSITELTEKLNEIITTVNALSGVDGGHLATDEDIQAINSEIDSIKETLASGGEVDLTEIETAITSLGERITTLEGKTPSYLRLNYSNSSATINGDGTVSFEDTSKTYQDYNGTEYVNSLKAVQSKQLLNVVTAHNNLVGRVKALENNTGLGLTLKYIDITQDNFKNVLIDKITNHVNIFLSVIPDVTITSNGTKYIVTTTENRFETTNDTIVTGGHTYIFNLSNYTDDGNYYYFTNGELTLYFDGSNNVMRIRRFKQTLESASYVTTYHENTLQWTSSIKLYYWE